MPKHRKVSKTKKRITAIGVTAAVPAGALLLAPTAAFASELPPDSIVQCESNGNPRAQNPESTASGKYQMINGTWLAYGGGKYAPEAWKATEAQQDRVAAKLFAAEGTDPWNASSDCWAGKSMAPAKAAKEEAPKKAAPKKQAKKVVEKAQTTKVEKKTVSSASAKHTNGGDGLYTVKLGDTLSSLAKDNGTSVDRLMELNKDIIEMPDWIFAGERIHLS